MKILQLALTKLRNAEHFQLMTELKNLLLTFAIIIERLGRLFTKFSELFAKEDEALMVLQKSHYTDEMVEADQRRDNIFSGMVNMLNAALKHFDLDTVEAAKRLKIVFDAYGNLAKKPNDEETSGIYNLIQDLEGKYYEDAQRIGLTEWISALKTSNDHYSALTRNRDVETTEKPESKLKQIRLEMDEVYRDLTQAIESFGMVAEDPGEIEVYRDFIAQYNAIVQRYKNRLAQRAGRNAKEDEEEENND